MNYAGITEVLQVAPLFLPLLERLSPFYLSSTTLLFCPLLLALVLSIYIVQFSRCRSPSASFRLSPAQLPTAFAVRFEDPIFRSGLQIQRQIAWWARVGSNHRPYDYQSYALAS